MPQAMPQAIAETVFDIFYLGFAVITGLTMLIKGQNPLVRKAGAMTALLGGGDSFHLVPRVYALWTTGLEDNAAALGIGKFITSITMTVFYLILYYIWRDRYQIKEPEGPHRNHVGAVRDSDCALPASAKSVAFLPPAPSVRNFAQYPLCNHGNYHYCHLFSGNP